MLGTLEEFREAFRKSVIASLEEVTDSQSTIPKDTLEDAKRYYSKRVKQVKEAETLGGILKCLFAMQVEPLALSIMVVRSFDKNRIVSELRELTECLQ